jgi:hypothetical protein
MEKYLKIKSILEDLEIDVDKYVNKKNKSAGLRIRKSMQEVKDLAQAIRKEILDAKKL